MIRCDKGFLSKGSFDEIEWKFNNEINCKFVVENSNEPHYPFVFKNISLNKYIVCDIVSFLKLKVFKLNSNNNGAWESFRIIFSNDEEKNIFYDFLKSQNEEYKKRKFDELKNKIKLFISPIFN